VSATVEWVETTGKTVEEAKEAALDQLGVDEAEAEFEVLEEPRAGLFGRTRGVGRVRARILPKAPRPKQERRRKTKGASSERGDATSTESDDAGSDAGAGPRGNGGSGGESGSNRNRNRQRRGGSGDRSKADRPAGDRSTGDRTTGEKSSRDSGATDQDSDPKRNKERELMDPTAQCEAVTSFLDGIGTAFGLEVTTTAIMDDDVLRATIDGSEVGLFIGPRLGTLDALQEITRNVLQRHADGREYAKVVLDVSGVREMRRTALSTFVADAARTVLDDGVEVSFEVMSSPDRKVVHDAVSDIEGVVSASVGEDPRRRVVLRPA